MFGKKSNPTENLAQTLLDTMSEAMTAYRAKSPYDKTFFCTILGVNRKFVDDVPNTDKAELISKFSIPASLDEGEKNYYTIKINGAYYVKQSPFTFKLYENVNVRVPNGAWNNIYIEGNISENSNTFELPELYVSTDEPEGTEERPIKEHDYWAEIDDDNDKNLKSFYEYQNLGTSENPEYDWVVLYNIKEQEQSQRKIYVQETQPYNANKGDIWLKTVARRYDTNIVNIYERGNSSWALRGTFNNTGSSLQNGNEIYNDYTKFAILYGCRRRELDRRERILLRRGKERNAQKSKIFSRFHRRKCFRNFNRRQYLRKLALRKLTLRQRRMYKLSDRRSDGRSEKYNQLDNYR